MTTAFINSSFRTSMRPVAAATSLAKAPVVKTRLRVTARGRAVLAGLVVALVFTALAVFGFNANSATAGDAGSTGGTVQYVTVQSGESLWQVAEQIAPNKDPRDVIADIERLNGLDSANVAAGASLAVPSY